MHKTPQPERYDAWLCDRAEETRGLSIIYCACFQGYEANGEWRVYVDRNGVAYTIWKPF